MSIHPSGPQGERAAYELPLGSRSPSRAQNSPQGDAAQDSPQRRARVRSEVSVKRDFYHPTASNDGISVSRPLLPPARRTPSPSPLTPPLPPSHPSAPLPSPSPPSAAPPPSGPLPPPAQRSRIKAFLRGFRGSQQLPPDSSLSLSFHDLFHDTSGRLSQDAGQHSNSKAGWEGENEEGWSSEGISMGLAEAISREYRSFLPPLSDMSVLRSRCLRPTTSDEISHFLRPVFVSPWLVVSCLAPSREEGMGCEEECRQARVEDKWFLKRRCRLSSGIPEPVSCTNTSTRQGSVDDVFFMRISARLVSNPPCFLGLDQAEITADLIWVCADLLMLSVSADAFGFC
jgi:hypothetical protein